MDLQQKYNLIEMLNNLADCQVISIDVTEKKEGESNEQLVARRAITISE